jgi:type I restriction enzyme M protein
MNNIEAIQKELLSALETYQDYRELSEVRDSFLVFYILRYLSSDISHFYLPEDYKLNVLLFEKNNILNRLKAALKYIDERLGLFDDELDFIMGGSKEENIYEVLQKLNQIYFEDVAKKDKTIFQNSFQRLLEYFAENSDKNAGEFFSPHHIGELMAELVIQSMNNKPINSIYDPACGVGGFLIKASETLQKIRSSNEKTPLIGQEINRSTWTIAKFNLLIHGLDYSELSLGDTLLSPQNCIGDKLYRKFDVILTNPPFSLKWDNQRISVEEDCRFRLGLPPNKSADYAFILHVIESLSEDGSAAIITPKGVLFRGGQEAKIRRQIIEKGYIETVIGLPDNLFLGTHIPVNILILRKNKPSKKVLFVDASDLYERGRVKNYISDKNIKTIVEVCKKRTNQENRSSLVSVKDISSNNFRLDVPLYISHVITDNVSIQQLIVKQTKLEQELNQLQLEMKELIELANLG